MPQLHFHYTINSRQSFDKRRNPIMTLNFLILISSDSSNDERINEFHDPNNYEILKTVVIENFYYVLNAYINQLQAPPSVIKIIMDNCEIPNIVIKDSFVAVTKCFKRVIR